VREGSFEVEHALVDKLEDGVGEDGLGERGREDGDAEEGRLSFCAEDDSS
jgi:hypothetical protein